MTPSIPPPGRLVSRADRCASCAHRDLLYEQEASNFVNASFGGLEMFECPVNAGWWHTWSPTIEQADTQQQL